MGLGDELMATGDVKRLHANTGQKVVVLDRKDRPRWHPIFNYNPKIVQPAMVRNIHDHPIVRSGPGRRPYADYDSIEALGAKRNPNAKDQKQLRRAASRLMFNYDYQAEGGEIFFSPDEQNFGTRIAKSLGVFYVIEPNIKGRVPAKQWGHQNWQRLAKLMQSSGMKPVQLGPGRQGLHGVQYVTTRDFRYAMAVMQHAAGFVVPEGGMHHAFGTLHKKGVALFAGRTPLTLSYPEQMTWFIEHQGGACGMEHVDCAFCRQLWVQLDPERVLQMLTEACA